MLRKNVIEKRSGFRALEPNETMVVSGGWTNEDDTIPGAGGFQNPQIEYFSATGIWIDDAVVADALVSTMGGTGFGTGGNPDAVNHGCPTNQTCTPVEGANDMYVRGEDGKIYLSEKGIERAVNGADIDWWGVAADLMIIVSGSVAGVGAGVLGIVMGMIGMTGKTMNELGDPTQQQ